MIREEIVKRLKAPFAFNEIQWRVSSTTTDKARGLAVAYLDARTVQDRLDEVVGTFGWTNEYREWHGGAQLCKISIFNNESGNWLSKICGAENSDIESTKGGLSDAFKRAAVLWGVGRYLYNLGNTWVELEAKGKGQAIKQSEYTKLEQVYNAAVSRIFGSAVNTGVIKGTSGKQASPAPPPPASQPASAGQAPATQKPNSNPPPHTPLYDFKVHSIKPSGNASQLLELRDANGKTTSGYIKAGDQSVTVGTLLRGVKLERKSSSYGEYNIITDYQAA